MQWIQGLRQPGVLAALAAALLFGAATPLAKLLLGSVSPWLLAGLLYLGSGLGLTLYRAATRAPRVALPRKEIPWFLGAILSGGVLAPLLLMVGLAGTPASGASLLLNAEGLFTTLLAWFVFREQFDRRVLLGMIAILAGIVTLTWPAETRFTSLSSSLEILGACFLWGLDNNFTRKVSLTDATWIASVKGLVAGAVNLALALALGDRLPPLPQATAALGVGFLAYGVSLALFVVGLRHLGTARTGAYFSIAPFVGAVLAVALGEAVTPALGVAGALMATGIWLHLTERHEHRHVHVPLTHDHDHVHDEHHQHPHAQPVAPGTRHRHLHGHEALTHTHRHFPDAHHSHEHQPK
jgi:drug/metabolite transporter (DMT)-like permease